MRTGINGQHGKAITLLAGRRLPWAPQTGHTQRLAIRAGNTSWHKLTRVRPGRLRQVHEEKSLPATDHAHGGRKARYAFYKLLQRNELADHTAAVQLPFALPAS